MVNLEDGCERGFAAAVSALAAFAFILCRKIDQWSILKTALRGFAAATSALATFAFILYRKIDQWLIDEGFARLAAAISDSAASAIILKIDN